jgi:hypothetical protein
MNRVFYAFVYNKWSANDMDDRRRNMTSNLWNVPNQIGSYRLINYNIDNLMISTFSCAHDCIVAGNYDKFN